MGNKTIFELTTATGRSVNTTAEHPYLTIINDKQKCNEYINNGFNNHIPESWTQENSCLRWVEVRELSVGTEIAVPKTNDELTRSYSVS